jgi:retron-type reverse transcriptase
MIKFIEHRIQDPNIIRLIKRFLKAGFMEAGEGHKATEGTAQGGQASPVLANIYLHYVMDLWFEKRIRKQCKGAAYMVRYADDAVFCFQFEHEAREFYETLIDRVAQFGLEISKEKSKIIAFGGYATKKAKDKDGKRAKPETFDFLGFTHYCSTRQDGSFRGKNVPVANIG